MTVEEIFGKISSHMVRGMMFHEQMCNYYDFLCLNGYKRCHEYHYLCEAISNRRLQRFFINHYNKLIPDYEVESTNEIPSRYTRQEVDKSTKRNAVGNGIANWLNWEKETKDLYSQMSKELYAFGDVTVADYICRLAEDTEREIKYAERKQIDLESVDYDLAVIIMEQDDIHDKFKKKLREKMSKW